ncbi:MAG TPA: MFS transporter [Micropepsaceae bacterium]|nr:MFS transporter [Micropepsaceae bacterium]
MAQPKTVDIAEVVETQEKGLFPVGIFLMCCLVMLVDGFNQQSLNYAAPSIIEDWGIKQAMMTYAFDINIFGWMLGAVGFSMLADRIGRRNSILLAIFIFGVFTTALPLATNLAQLSAIRFVSALGIGGGMPMAISLVADYAKTKNRGLMVTLLYLGYTGGSSGGGFLAAALTRNGYGWQSIFLVGGIVSLAIGVILFFALPESVRYLVLRHGSKERILGYARKLKPSAHYEDGTEFTIKETARKGVPVKHLFTEGRTAMTAFLWLALGFSFVTHFFLSAWLTTLLSKYSGLMSIPTAQMTSALFQAGAGFAFGVGYLLDKRGIVAVTWILLLGAIPVAALGLLGSGTAMTMALALISGILVLGGGIGLNAVSSMVYPTFIRSTGTGSAFAAARIGALMGPAIAGYLIYVETPLPLIFLAGALPMLAAAATSFMLERSMTPDSAREMASRSALARH